MVLCSACFQAPRAARIPTLHTQSATTHRPCPCATPLSRHHRDEPSNRNAGTLARSLSCCDAAIAAPAAPSSASCISSSGCGHPPATPCRCCPTSPAPAGLAATHRIPASRAALAACAFGPLFSATSWARSAPSSPVMSGCPGLSSAAACRAGAKRAKRAKRRSALRKDARRDPAGRVPNDQAARSRGRALVRCSRLRFTGGTYWQGIHSSHQQLQGDALPLRRAVERLGEQHGHHQPALRHREGLRVAKSREKSHPHVSSTKTFHTEDRSTATRRQIVRRKSPTQIHNMRMRASAR